jgi:hypothetical protein
MSMTQTKADVLAEPTEGLEQALQMAYPGHEREWADEVSGALANVHQALRLHAAATEGTDGLLTKVDLTRPTLARQVGELRQEHRDLFDQAGALEAQLRSAGQAFQSVSGSPAISPLPEPAKASAVPDFGALRDKVARLLVTLKQHAKEEAKIILESVNTDIGVGD